MSALARRMRRLGPVGRDRLLAAALFVAAQSELVISGPGASSPVLIAIAATGYSVPLAWRRSHTLAAVCVAACSLAPMSALIIVDQTDYFIPFVSAMTFSYSAGAYGEGRRAVLGLVVMVVAIFTVSALAPDPVVGDYIFPASFAVIAWLGGRAVRTRTELTEELHEAAQREADAHAAEAHRAAADERRRIAREMHDVVAHSVSVMVVQAGGARRILDKDPARAVAAAEQIERTGREALGEMRRLLGVLHAEDDAHDTRAPQPGMTGVEALVERAREAGLPVSLAVDGDRRSLPAGLDLAAYRVLQEGLTNALKYSGGAATEVRVSWGERELELEVTDRGPGALRERTGLEGGHGLVGMRERVRLYGGSLEAGRRRGGGFRVHAKLPLVTDEVRQEAVR